MNVVVVYNNGKIKETLEELWNAVEAWIGNGDSIFLIGNFNARIGK